MRKLFSMLVMLFVGVSSIFAQDPTQPLPLDPAVRVGVLDNGMTYFIRHNDKPKGQASFYIYHDVGDTPNIIANCAIQMLSDGQLCVCQDVDICRQCTGRRHTQTRFPNSR